MNIYWKAFREFLLVASGLTFGLFIGRCIEQLGFAQNYWWLLAVSAICLLVFCLYDWFYSVLTLKGTCLDLVYIKNGRMLITNEVWYKDLEYLWGIKVGRYVVFPCFVTGCELEQIHEEGHLKGVPIDELIFDLDIHKEFNDGQIFDFNATVNVLRKYDNITACYLSDIGRWPMFKL